MNAQVPADPATASETSSTSPARWHLFPRGIERWLFPATFFVSWCVLFVGSWGPAISVDEAATVVVARRSLAEVLRTVHFDSALEPYYIAMKLWSSVSLSPVWLRLPSVLAMAAAIGVLVIFVRKLIDLPTAIFVGLVMLAIPAISRYGEDARPYAFAILGIVVATAFSWRYVRGGQIWDAVGTVVFLLFAALMHEFSLIIIGAWIVAALIAPVAPTRKSALVRTCVPSAITVVLMTPYLWIVAQTANGDPNPLPVSLGNIYLAGWDTVSASHRNGWAIALAAVLGMLALLGLVAGWRRDSNSRRLAVLAASWLIVPPLVLIAATAVADIPGIVPRYWTLWLPGLAILAAIGVAALWRISWIPAIASVVVIVLLGLPTQIFIRSYDGRYGAAAVNLPRVLSQPSLVGLPLWVSTFRWRSIAAIDPQFLIDRAPLVQDPAPSGRIHPEISEPGSADFAKVVAQSPALIVYPSWLEVSGIPKTSDFTTHRSFAPTAAIFSQPWVRCSYFGRPLAVLAQPSRTAQLAPATVMAAQIVSASGGHAECVVG